MRLTINDRRVEAEAGESVLQCAIRHGIEIPRLCTLPQLAPFGACRMCIVEIDGVRGFPSACATPAAEGMIVRTETAAVAALRRKVLELILLEHPSACLLCEKQELCEQYRPHATKAGRTTGCHTCNNKHVCVVRDLAHKLGVRELPVPPVYRGLALDRSDPFIDRDLNLCILCGRCVRVCKAQHGNTAIDFVGRGSDTHIGQAFGRSLADAGCRFCGSCIDVCPTGSLADRYAKWYGAAQRYTATTCTLCDAACALTVSSGADGRATMTRAVSARVPICVVGRFAIPEFLNGVTRLQAPQVRVGTRLRRAPWADAYTQAAARLTPFVGDGFALVCDTTCTLEDRYVFRKFTREVMRSPHYIEIAPDMRGVSRQALPDGVRAALLTGDFVDAARLAALDVLIVEDCYPSAVSDHAHFVLPAAVLAETAGTWVDGHGLMRPLRSACAAPGEARADWQIVCGLAAALGAEGFAYASAADILAEMRAGKPRLWINRPQPPLAATDPRQRRTHFRGHRLDDYVHGLRALGLGEESSAPAAATSGG